MTLEVIYILNRKTCWSMLALRLRDAGLLLQKHFVCCFGGKGVYHANGLSTGNNTHGDF